MVYKSVAQHHERRLKMLVVNQYLSQHRLVKGKVGRFAFHKQVWCSLTIKNQNIAALTQGMLLMHPLYLHQSLRIALSEQEMNDMLPHPLLRGQDDKLPADDIKNTELTVFVPAKLWLKVRKRK